MKAICPTCGETRWIPVEFGECVRCHETTNLLEGKPGTVEKRGADCGWMKPRPFDTERNDPFEP